MEKRKKGGRCCTERLAAGNKDGRESHAVGRRRKLRGKKDSRRRVSGKRTLLAEVQLPRTDILCKFSGGVNGPCGGGDLIALKEGGGDRASGLVRPGDRVGCGKGSAPLAISRSAASLVCVTNGGGRFEGLSPERGNGRVECSGCRGRKENI